MLITEETKQKISESHKGEKCYMFGNHHTEETKQKMSISHKGITNTWQSKSVSQFTKDGEFVNSFRSLLDAEKATGIANSSISNVCKGKRKSAGGFVWRYNDKEVN